MCFDVENPKHAEFNQTFIPNKQHEYILETYCSIFTTYKGATNYNSSLALRYLATWKTNLKCSTGCTKWIINNKITKLQ